jgi:hypothetical protein
MPDGPLPKAPRTPAPAARHALDLYARLYRRTPPPSAPRRAVLSGRLSHALTRLSAPEAASYYAQLVAWRGEDP